MKETALHKAALYNKPEVAAVLIQNGAEVDLRNRVSEDLGIHLSVCGIHCTSCLAANKFVQISLSRIVNVLCVSN